MVETRRETLVKIGSVLTVGAGIAGTAQGSENYSPVEISGERLYQLHVNGEEYWMEETFSSKRPEMVNSFGTEQVRYGSELISEESYYKLRKEALQSANTTVSETSDGSVEIRYKDTALLGTMEQLYEHEKHLNENRVSTLSGPADDYPIFVYKGDDPEYDYDLGEITGPVYLGWNVGLDPSEIESEADMTPHWSIDLAATRYVIKSWNDIIGQDEDMGRNEYPTDQANQYHVRLYDVSDVTSDVEVIGQSHYDPVDHGHIGGQIGDVNWQFSDSRQEMSEPWSDVSTHSIGNGSLWDSSEGRFNYIE